MPDTITALDTASTDELIAALVARHRAALGQTCGQTEDLTTLVMLAATLGQSIEARVHEAVEKAAAAFLTEHPAWRDADTAARVAMFRRLLAPGDGKRPPSPGRPWPVPPPL